MKAGAEKSDERISLYGGVETIERCTTAMRCDKKTDVKTGKRRHESKDRKSVA
jgi:hypothetical protein